MAAPTARPVSWGPSAAVAGAFGVLYFIAHAGVHVVQVGEVDWLLRHDWTQHYLGWAFFRAAPAWSWPVGALPQVFEPYGASIATMDANPLASLLLRPFSAWLPVRAQFIGPSLAVHFALQGAAGAYLAARIGAGRVVQALFGALLVTAPTLLHRVRHDTLCAQWLIVVLLASFWLPIADGPAKPKGRRAQHDGWLWLACLSVAPFVHAYLLAMATPLVWGAAAFQARRLGGRQAAMAGAFAAVATLAAVAGCGALGLMDEYGGGSASGFGYFSANLLTFIEPSDWSRFLPALAVPNEGQRFEGFAYLGAGALLWAGATAAWPWLFGARQPDRPNRAPFELWLVALALYVYALGDNPYLGRSWLADWRSAYDHLPPLARLFRSSGRFAWPLGYVLLSATLAHAVRRLRPPAQVALLAVAVAVQGAEVRRGEVRAQFSSPTVAPLRDPRWLQARGEFAHLVLTPPWFPGSDIRCGPVYPDKYEVAPLLFAAENGLGVNCAYLAHYDRERVIAACKQSSHEWLEGELHDDTLYIVAREIARHAAARLPVSCRELDKYVVCVKKRVVPSAFERALRNEDSINDNPNDNPNAARRRR